MRSLINFALNVFAIAVALWAVVAVIPGITITPAETGNFIAVAIVFIIINAVVMPVLRVLGAPLTCLTLGLFSLVINGAALIIVEWALNSGPGDRPPRHRLLGRRDHRRHRAVHRQQRHQLLY